MNTELGLNRLLTFVKKNKKKQRFSLHFLGLIALISTSLFFKQFKSMVHADGLESSMVFWIWMVTENM